MRHTFRIKSRSGGSLDQSSEAPSPLQSPYHSRAKNLYQFIMRFTVLSIAFISVFSGVVAAAKPPHKDRQKIRIQLSPRYTTGNFQSMVGHRTCPRGWGVCLNGDPGLAYSLNSRCCKGTSLIFPHVVCKPPLELKVACFTGSTYNPLQ